MCISVCLCVYVCIYVFSCIGAYGCVSARVFACVYTYVCVCVCACTNDTSLISHILLSTDLILISKLMSISITALLRTLSSRKWLAVKHNCLAYGNVVRMRTWIGCVGVCIGVGVPVR